MKLNFKKKLIIEINLENAAFDEDPTIEVHRILEEYGKWAEETGGLNKANLRDINGNTVGKAVAK
jgi:hypothetical protein